MIFEISNLPERNTFKLNAFLSQKNMLWNRWLINDWQTSEIGNFGAYTILKKCGIQIWYPITPSKSNDSFELIKKLQLAKFPKAQTSNSQTFDMYTVRNNFISFGHRLGPQVLAEHCSLFQ